MTAAELLRELNELDECPRVEVKTGSEPRNPLIASVLHETHFAETKGSGIRVMRRLMRAANLPPPTFDTDRAADEFVATFFLHNLLDADDLAWLGHFAELSLSNDEAKALVHVREAGRITNAEYRELNGVDTLDASAHLRRLRDAGLLEQHDCGAATYYTPTERLLRPAGSTPPPAEEPTEQGGEPTRLAEQPTKLGAQPTRLDEQSTRLSAGSAESGAPAPVGEDAALGELPPELAAQIAGLNRWTPQPELRRLIRSLCAWKPLTTGELSSLLGRSRTYLRISYIAPMVQAGELEYTIPDKLSDPNQKYWATQHADA